MIKVSRVMEYRVYALIIKVLFIPHTSFAEKVRCQPRGAFSLIPRLQPGDKEAQILLTILTVFSAETVETVSNPQIGGWSPG